MSEQKIITEKRGHVLLIGFNRPQKYNAFDLEMFMQLADAYGQLNADPELRVGLVHGNGKHFHAGLELPTWGNTFSAGKWLDFAPHQCDPCGLTPDRRLNKPIVMAIHGICFTSGIELALAADIRVVGDDARFGQIEIKRGIYPVFGATVRMVQEFGWGNAQRYLLTGDEFNAAEAHRIGLAQEVVPAGQQFDRALEIAQRVAKQAPLGVYASLKSSRITMEKGFAQAVAALMPDLQPIMASDDAKEGVQSFVERREANFKGR